jgi:hypothetical protein
LSLLLSILIYIEQWMPAVSVVQQASSRTPNAVAR